MNIDDAKDTLRILIDAIDAIADDKQALDIALWFLERDDKLRKLSDPWLEEWLREYDLEHPRPGP